MRTGRNCPTGPQEFSAAVIDVNTDLSSIHARSGYPSDIKVAVGAGVRLGVRHCSAAVPFAGCAAAFPGTKLGVTGFVVPGFPYLG